MDRPELDLDGRGDGPNVVGGGFALAYLTWIVCMMTVAAWETGWWLFLLIPAMGLAPLTAKLIVYGASWALYLRTAEYRREREIRRLKRAVELAEIEAKHRKEIEKLEQRMNRALDIEDIMEGL